MKKKPKKKKNAKKNHLLQFYINSEEDELIF